MCVTFRNTTIFHDFCYIRKLHDTSEESEKRLILTWQLSLNKAGEKRLILCGKNSWKCSTSFFSIPFGIWFHS